MSVIIIKRIGYTHLRTRKKLNLKNVQMYFIKNLSFRSASKLVRPFIIDYLTVNIPKKSSS